MALRSSMVLLCGSSLMAGVAAAGPVGFVHHDGLGPMDPETPSIDANETASFSLRGTNQNIGDLGFYNSGGDVSIKIGDVPVSIGTSPSGVGLLAEWSESSLGDTQRKVRAIWQTVDGSALLPFGSEIDGERVQFLRWNLGVSDIVSWADEVIGIELVSATFFGSFDGGQTFADIEPIDALFDNGISQWTIDGAFDRGDNLISDTSGPSGYNFIMTEYVFDAEFEPVPSPGVLAVFAGAGLMGVRRRRS